MFFLLDIGEISTNNDSEAMADDMEIDSESQNNAASSILNIPHIEGVASTQSRCFICHSVTGRSAIPWAAIRQVWFVKKFYVPKSNRTCLAHLTTANKFTDEALELVESSKESLVADSAEFGVWLREVSDLPSSNSPYNFEHDGIDSSMYPMFFGISKDNFDDLVQYLHGKP